MKSYYEDHLVKVYNGDVLQVLKTLPDEIMQTVVTSPPYWGLRDYGTATWEGGSSSCDHDFPQGGRDPETSGKQLTNAGTTHHQYRDICKKCGAKRIDNQLGLEKTPEEYVEKMVGIFREVKRVLKEDGTVWLVLGDSYNGSGGPGNQRDSKAAKGQFVKFENPNRKHETLKPKDLIGIPWRVAFALQKDGWYLRQDIIWSKPNPMPESVQDRCTKSHEYIFLLSKNAKYYYDVDAIKEKKVFSTVTDSRTNINGYRRDRLYPGANSCGGTNLGGPDGDRNKRSVWTVNTKPYRAAHFAVFPPELITPCIKAGSKEGDIVLDPFGGSGTTADVSKKLGRQCISIELNAEYCKLHADRWINYELVF